MPTLVLDASVLLKTVLPEDKFDEEEALLLFKKYSEGSVDIIEPVFWVCEIGNTFSRKLPLRKAILGFNFLLAQKFQMIQFSDKQLLTIARFSKRNKVAFYDASYHLMAKFNGAIFVTADKNYFKKFPKDKNIALLWDLKL